VGAGTRCGRLDEVLEGAGRVAGMKRRGDGPRVARWSVLRAAIRGSEAVARHADAHRRAPAQG
jgi:hypothetical protein